jgi:hypothetical protein
MAIFISALSARKCVNMAAVSQCNRGCGMALSAGASLQRCAALRQRKLTQPGIAMKISAGGANGAASRQRSWRWRQ